MPKLLYTWYFEKFTASVTSSGHSALRHEVSRICTILNIQLFLSLFYEGLPTRNVRKTFNIYIHRSNEDTIMNMYYLSICASIYK